MTLQAKIEVLGGKPECHFVYHKSDVNWSVMKPVPHKRLAASCTAWSYSFAVTVLCFLQICINNALF
jgi:hypothetical protein